MNNHSLDSSNQEEYQPGKWRTAIPGPFYLGWFWGLFNGGKRLVCECDQKFKTRSEYGHHYMEEIERAKILGGL